MPRGTCLHCSRALKFVLRTYVRTWTNTHEYFALMHTVQLASKFTARIGKNAYLARNFARHVRLLAFDARVSKSLAQDTMLASYAARDLYVLTCNPTRDGFSVHENLLASHFTQ